MPDPNLAPSIVRWHARRYLDNAGHAAHDLEEDYGREQIGNIGLLILWNKFQFRMRKARYAELPVPASEPLKKFYDQQCLEFETQEPAELRLMILWDTDIDYAELTALIVVLPRMGGDNRETTKAYWSQPILDEVVLDEDLPLELDTDADAEETGQ